MDSQVMACVGRSRDSCLAGRIGLGRHQSGWLRSVLESVVDQLRGFKCRAENHPPQSEVDLQACSMRAPRLAGLETTRGHLDLGSLAG